MKIRTKFRLVSLFIVLIVVGAVAAVYSVARSELTNKIHNHLNLVADLQHDRVEDVLERDFERLEQVSARRPLQENVVRYLNDSAEDSRDRVIVILREACEAVESFTEVSIIDGEGKVIGSSNLDHIDASFGDQQFMQDRETFAEQVVENGGRAVSFGLVEGKLEVVLSEPFTSEDGTEHGLIVIRTTGEALSATSFNEDQTVQTVLVKKLGARGVTVLTPLSLAGERSDLPEDCPLYLASHNYDGFFTDAPDVMLGVPVLAVTRTFGSDGMGLGFVAKMEHKVAFSGLRKIRNYSLVLLALALVAMEFAFLAIRKSILNPVRRLAETANLISGGDLSRRVEIGSQDEVGELGRDFNQMTERLIEANTGLERKVEERTAELERSNSELAQFAYVASHDLKEPLRMVTSYVQLLERRLGKDLDAESKEFMSFAVDGAKRMRGLIDDLLAYSRVGTKRRPFEKVASQAVVDAALMNLKIAIDECGAKVEVGELPSVLADATQLTQLFQNLIANAIKFRGERTPEVMVKAEKKGRRWEFSVRDNGIGIEKEYLDQIFLIFQRLHNRGEYEGTGIGLAVCKKIVELHGGKIRVESVPGEGTTFLFDLTATEGRGTEGLVRDGDES